MNNESASTQLAIVYVAVSTLVPNRRNARTHSKRQVHQIADSIRLFGFINPVLINHENTIIAGHGRVEAAKLLGTTRIPTIRIETLSDNQLRAYILADNRLAEKAGWDKATLAIELQHLLVSNLDLDVTVTGFEIPEIDLIIEESQKAQQDKDDAFETCESGLAVTNVGDLWRLGKYHRVLCGDSQTKGSFKQLMGPRRADVVFTDPPYNVRIDGHASGNGSIHHRDFANASGELSEAEFVFFLTGSLRLLSQCSTPDSVHFIFMDWRHQWELLAAGRQIYDALLNVCVWVKNNGGLGSFYRSRHELVFVFRNGKGRHSNNVQLGKFGRNRTNVWEYPGATTFSRQGDEGNLLAFHPTVKPVQLVADAILDCSARGEVVLDSFLGSGTTLMAAERVGRICYGIELDPLYVDTAIRRWQRYTGDRAIHEATGKCFDDVASELEGTRDR